MFLWQRGFCLVSLLSLFCDVVGMENYGKTVKKARNSTFFTATLGTHTIALECVCGGMQYTSIIFATSKKGRFFTACDVMPLGSHECIIALGSSRGTVSFWHCIAKHGSLVSFRIARFKALKRVAVAGVMLDTSGYAFISLADKEYCEVFEYSKKANNRLHRKSVHDNHGPELIDIH